MIQTESHPSNRRSSWPRSLVLAVMLVFAAALSVGCNREERRREEENRAKFFEEEALAASARRPLNVGESVVAEFATDGLWHPLPYAAHSEQVLRMQAFGATRNYGDNLIEFMIGSRRMVVSNDRDFLVNEGGPLAVRINPGRVKGLGPSAQLQITRVR